jgi:outer membrane protein insertion porin family
MSNFEKKYNNSFLGQKYSSCTVLGNINTPLNPLSRGDFKSPLEGGKGGVNQLGELKILLKIFLILIFIYFINLCLSSQIIAQTKNQESFSADKIKFEGVKRFNDRKIKELIGLNENVIFAQNQILEKQNLILEIYRDEGFFSVRVDSIDWPNKNNQSIIIYLFEGERFRVDQFFIFGNEQFSLNQIRSWIKTKSGEIFRQKQLEVDIQELLNRYSENGFLLAKVEVQKLDLDYENNLVDIVLNISENKQTPLSQIEIIGNETTKDKVIIRELGIQKGNLLNQEKFSRIPERVRRLSYISLASEPEIKFTPDSLAVVQLEVLEQNSSNFNGVLGYNPKQGNQAGYVSGQIDLQFQNLLGTGRSFLAFWDKRGPDSQSLRLNYQEPWILGWPINGDFGFYQNVQDTSFVKRSWHLGFKMYLFENISTGIRIGQESVIPDSIGRVLYGLPRSDANHLYLDVGFDSRNHIWNPTRGLMYHTSVDFVRKEIDPLLPEETIKKQDFQRVSLDLEFIQPLFLRQVLSVGFHGRQVKIGEEQIPIDELYRLGGANNLRGYRDDQFLGSQVAWATLEYRLILERDSRIGLFLDTGYIGRRDFENNWQQLFRLGYGFGLLTKTNLGIIGFDYGLGKGDSFSQGKIHVRLINSF